MSTVSSDEEILDGFRTIADAIDGLADAWEDQLAAGVPPKWLVHRAIAANRLVAAAARPATGGDQS